MTTFIELDYNAPTTPALAARYWKGACKKLLQPDNRMKPTPRQGECLELIKHYMNKNLASPSYRELAEELGTALSNVFRLVEGLEERGYLMRTPDRKRNIVLID